MIELRSGGMPRSQLDDEATNFDKKSERLPFVFKEIERVFREKNDEC
jgi:hypothetical protein